MVRKIGLGVALLALTACASHASDEDVSADIAAIVRPTTHVVEATPGEDVTVEPSRLVFRRAGHEDLLARAHGDVLACSVGDGFLRKVDRAHSEGDSIVVDTLPAGLGDAIEQGRVRERVVSSTTTTQSIRPLGVGDALLRIPIAGRVPMGSSGAVDIEEGHLDLDPDVDVDFAMRGGSLERAKVIVSGHADAALRAKFDVHRPSHVVDGPFVRIGHPGWKLASAPPLRRIVMVGWLPVVVTVRLDLYLEYLVEISGDVSGELDMSGTSTVRGGVELTNGEWRGIGEGSFALGRENKIVVSRRVFGGDLVLSARLSVQLYETAGPFVTLDAYTGVENERVGATTTWFGRSGIRSRAGVDANVFGTLVLGYQVALFDRSARIPFSSPEAGP